MFCAVFWNIGGKSHRQGIVRLITALQRQEDADVIALAECDKAVLGNVLRWLNSNGKTEWTWITTNSRVQVLARTARMEVSESGSHKYSSLLEIRRKRAVKLRLAVSHMVSRVRKEFDDVDRELGQFAELIRTSEAKHKHDNTIVLGDLNANPFSDGVVTARGLHAVMSRAVAEQGSRQVSHRDWPYFFNPMWQFFGDGAAAPPGTCYYPPEGSHKAFHWNTFDQVLIRPNLLQYYSQDSVRIIHALGSELLSRANWVPDRDVASDHFPIRIRLDC